MMKQETTMTRRGFLKTSGVVAGTALSGGFSHGWQAHNDDAKQWKVAIVKDTSKPMIGLHGLEFAFRGLPNIEVVALVESNTDKLAEKMAEVKAKRHYTSCEALLEKETPDIVVLTSRLAEDHFPQIRLFAERGCHIYCEKPLSVYLHEADEIVQIAEKNKIIISMAHPCRNGLGFVTMKRLVHSGKIGTPLTIQGWGKSDHRGGGEDMMTLGTHIFDLMIYFFGVPECVSADVRVDGKPFVGPELTQTVEPIGPAAGDELFATFRFPGGVNGIFESRRNLYKFSGDNRMGICVMGSKGMLSCRFSDGDREPHTLRFSNVPCAAAKESVVETIELLEDRVIPGAEPVDYSYGLGGPGGLIFYEAGRYAVYDLMQSILENRQPITNIYDARAALEMIYGVYSSHIRKTPIEFPLKDRTHPLKDFVKS